MFRGRRCFTLIELLVVIAIIGILAAMLFPVFARARESARKTQCLSNVKNIAMGIQMYLADYDRLFPSEHNQQARQYIIDYCGASCDSAADCRATGANPYLRHPVILDEYIKNRDVWRCPSGRYAKSFAINWGYGTGNWLKYLQDTMSSGGCRLSICSSPFPTGWGGTVTDSVVQGACSGGAGAFVQQIACPYTLDDMSGSSMNDAAKQVACADAGVIIEQLDRTSWVAYPDTCRIDSVLCNQACGGDWSNCTQSQTCSPLAIDHGGNGKSASDVEIRKTQFHSRHLGGSNLGFCDGHAKWMASEDILFGGENWSGYAKKDTELYGLGCCFTPEAVNRYR